MDLSDKDGDASRLGRKIYLTYYLEANSDGQTRTNMSKLRAPGTLKASGRLGLNSAHNTLASTPR